MTQAATFRCAISPSDSRSRPSIWSRSWCSFRVRALLSRREAHRAAISWRGILRSIPWAIFCVLPKALLRRWRVWSTSRRAVLRDEAHPGGHRAGGAGDRVGEGGSVAVQPLPGVRPVCLLRHVQRQRRPVSGLRAVGERVPLILPSLRRTAPRTGRLLLPRLRGETAGRRHRRKGGSRR